MPQKCHVIGCDHPVVANGLCRKHYMRVKRHGEVDETRPSDWGQREKHPAYSAWCNLRRSHRLSIPESWRDDFWTFVKDVPEKPQNAMAARCDANQDWSKSNFYWKETRACSLDRKEYMREWQRKSRAANREYYLDSGLRKRYGITLQWYKEQFAKQGGKCAICKQPETVVIKGKLIMMPIDHCHKTGKVRGLLCTKCNRALGLFGDDVEVLTSALEYISSSSGE